MTDQKDDFVNSARELAALLQSTFDTLGLDPQAASALLCAATGHFLSQMSGQVIAIERLRRTADHLERSMLLGVKGAAQ